MCRPCHPRRPCCTPWEAWHRFSSLQGWRRPWVSLSITSEEGRQPMVARLRLLCLGLGILSITMGCAATPPPMAPLRATLAPAAPAAPAAVPPVDVPPVVLPPPPLHPPYSAGGRTSDIYQSSPYEGSIDYERKMD